MTINNETVDVTDKDGNGWRIVRGCRYYKHELKRLRAWYDTAVFTDHIMAAVMANTHHVVLKIESGLGDVWQGTFAVPSAERAGEYNKRGNFQHYARKCWYNHLYRCLILKG